MRKLRSLRYVNDEAFARNWAGARAESPGYGPRRIEQELRQKGIAQSLAREVVRETFGQSGEEEKAKKLLARRFKGQNFKDSKMLRRAAAFLERRGYSSELISDLLRHPVEDN